MIRSKVWEFAASVFRLFVLLALGHCCCHYYQPPPGRTPNLSFCYSTWIQSALAGITSPAARTGKTTNETETWWLPVALDGAWWVQLHSFCVFTLRTKSKKDFQIWAITNNLSCFGLFHWLLPLPEKHQHFYSCAKMLITKYHFL